MKKLFKKILACCLVVCMVFTLCISAVTVSAEEFDGELAITVNGTVTTESTEAVVSYTASVENHTVAGIAAAKVDVAVPDGLTITKLEIVTNEAKAAIKFASNEDPTGEPISLDRISKGYVGAPYVDNGVFTYILWCFANDAIVLTDDVTLKVTYTGDFTVSATYPLSAEVEACRDDIDFINLEEKGANLVIEEAGCKHTETEEIPAVPATCTEPGSTAGEKCSVCGTVLTAPTTIEALGHTILYSDGDDEDHHTKYCSKCDYSEQEVHNFGETGTCVCGAVEKVACEHALGRAYYDETDNKWYKYCTLCDYKEEVSAVVDNEFKFFSHAAYISDTLGIAHMVKISTLNTDYKTLELVVSPQKYDANYNEVPGEIKVITFTVDPSNTKYLRAVYTGVGMYELGLNVSVYVKFYDAEGNCIAFSKTIDTTLAALLKSKYTKNPTDDYLKKVNTIVTDMLNMGAQAQIYFPKTKPEIATTCDLYKADLVTKDFESEYASTVIPELNQTDNLVKKLSDTEWDYANNRIGTGVSLKTTPLPSYQMRNKGSKPLDTSKLTFTLSYRKFYNAVDTENGDLVTDTISGDSWKVEGNWLTYACGKVAMYDLNKTFTVTVSYDGKEVYTHEYSVESFIYANLDNTTNGMNTLLRSIALFSASARDYFGTV